MIKNRLLVLTSLGLLAWASAASADSFRGKVVAVSDGDTIVVSKSGKSHVVQLAHIDAPELTQEFGQDARDFVRNLTRKEKVEVEIIETNDNKTVMARVRVGDRDLAAALVEAGLAWASDDASSAEIEAAQQKAKSAKEGLWAATDPTPPWQFRKEA